MQYKTRLIQGRIDQLLKVFPIVAVTGPRQAGKSTLLKHYITPQWQYFTLDDRDLLFRIQSDPMLFVRSLSSSVVIDEAQKAPDLFHAIKYIVDSGFQHKIILSGSANFLLMKEITESLAGRVGFIELLPFSLAESLMQPSGELLPAMLTLSSISKLREYFQERTINNLGSDKILDFILSGGFPKTDEIDATARTDWMSAYISTYLERDLRELAKIGDLRAFQHFYTLLAHQPSAIINFSSIASDTGLTVNTLKKYMSILEMSYQYRLLPGFVARKRQQLSKSPKIYALDTGLINHIIRYMTLDQMQYSAHWGGILETWVFSELWKTANTLSVKPNFYYWRTHNGAEVDFILEHGDRLVPIEVKSSSRLSLQDLRSMNLFISSQSNHDIPFGIILYRGTEVYPITANILAIPWTYWS